MRVPREPCFSYGVCVRSRNNFSGKTFKIWNSDVHYPLRSPIENHHRSSRTTTTTDSSTYHNNDNDSCCSSSPLVVLGKRQRQRPQPSPPPPRRTIVLSYPLDTFFLFLDFILQKSPFLFHPTCASVVAVQVLLFRLCCCCWDDNNAPPPPHPRCCCGPLFTNITIQGFSSLVLHYWVHLGHFAPAAVVFSPQDLVWVTLLV